MLKILRLANYIKTYRPFLLFLGKFFLTYILLSVVYQFYLSQTVVKPNDVDPFTRLVGVQTEFLAELFAADVNLSPHENQPSIKLIYNGNYVARIIEGCNALSVMILFVSFVVAFTGKFRTTVLFMVFGCVLIHFLNISRIALLASAIYHYPQYEGFLHGVLFPLFIYGVVFLLWVIWVNKFSADAK
ncbi:MAG: exosortase family protein XrtF [Flavobacterium sp.]|nr:exosortase family protein XrtF [Flavobacterium sp.]